MKNILNYFSLVKFSHTIFGLPFALIGFFSAVTIGGGAISPLLFCLVILCMVFARNAAMGFNRYADRDIDIINPRTARREIPSGVIKDKNALFFVLINCLAFISTTLFINTLCFYLSPVALIIILGYSLSKRFTLLCHVILGVALSVAPVGASLAVLGEFTLFPFMLGAVVVFWVSGFDVLYALQDSEFDKNNHLKSIPSRLGIKGALAVSALLHLIAIVGVMVLGLFFDMNYIYFIGALLFSLILVWEHIVVTPKDIKRVNLAFATMNGCASVVYAIFTIISLYL